MPLRGWREDRVENETSAFLISNMNGNSNHGTSPNDEEAVSITRGTSNNNKRSLLGTVLNFCNTFAVTILSVAVVWIFFQLQYVWYSLKEESDRIDALLEEIKNSQNKQMDDLNQKVESNHNLTLIQMAGTFTLLACLITLYHMTTHLRNYNEPIVQKRIVTILWMCPIYAVTAFFSLMVPAADGYLAVIRDFYEAYTVYTFLALLINILGRGDRNVVVATLAQHADHLKPPTRCLKSCYHPPPETSNEAKANAVLYECQVLAMQFVFCRPITSILSFVSTTLLQNTGDEGNSDGTEDSSPLTLLETPSFYIAMITNVSVFLAFTGLLKFYHAVADDLQWCQPFNKFMAIKGIVFLTFWQGLLISIFVSLHERNSDDDDSDKNSKSPVEQAKEIQHILICLEMVFFSIAHLCVFPAEEWEQGYRPKEHTRVIPTMGISEFARDVKYIVSSKHRRRIGEEGRDHASTLVVSGEGETEIVDAEAVVFGEARVEPYQDVPDSLTHRSAVASAHDASYQQAPTDPVIT